MFGDGSGWPLASVPSNGVARCDSIVGMDNADFLTALQRDGLGFVEACEAAGPAASVASCPGWTAWDLLWHLTEVHHFWRTIVGDHRDSWEGYEQPSRPADGQLAEMYREGLAAIVAVLAAVDPAAANWTWSNDQTAGFVVRRMAQETAVHRWDAESAAGRAQPIEAHLASDGIDEFLHHFLDWPADGPALVAGSVHLHCTDVAGEWTVREGDEAFVVSREHEKGDCAIRGAASDILLALWRRVPLTATDVVGDPGVAVRFVAVSPLE
jgi:uncharacterized protein (TIGR03083 family)